jgi:hypothetical protein
MITKLEPVYLGDAVYAGYDGYGITLHLNDHREKPCVYLDDETITNLIKYYERVKESRK